MQASKRPVDAIKQIQAERAAMLERARAAEFRKQQLGRPGLFRKLLESWRNRQNSFWRMPK